MKKRTRIGALLMAVVMIFSLTTVSFAEAGQWDPLTDPDTVKGTLYDYKTSYASTQFERGKPGALRMMPTYTEGGYVYNASAYCGATATSDNPDVVEVKTKDGHQDIVIGKWVGGIWDGADCLQVNVDAKNAGTATVQVNFYYTFTQNNDPFNHSKALWIYGTCYYTVTVTDTSQQDITLTYDANGGTGAPASETKTVTKGQSATFTVSSTVPTREGYTFKGWSTVKGGEVAYTGGNSITISKDTTLYAVWEENTPDPGPGPTPDNPGPGDKTPDMAELLTVECVTADAKHTPKSAQYDIVDKGTLTQATDTTWTYTVTLNRTTYINKFNGETKTAHTDKAPNDVITLTWNWKNGKWTKGFDENPVIKCECKTEIEPPTDGPTDDDVKAALGNLWVKCINGPKTGSNCTPCKWPAKLGYSGSDSLTKVSDTEYTVELGVDVL